MELSRLLVQHDITLVNGAGSIGIMGVMADEVLRLGGRVIGVIPSFMIPFEVCHQGLTELIVTEDMHSRKKKIVEISDAFVALPGGFGTMDELFEILTWSQLNLHWKNIGLLNVNAYYEPIIQMVNNMEKEGFLHSNSTKLLKVESDPEKLLSSLIHAERSRCPLRNGRCEEGRCVICDLRFAIRLLYA